MSVVASVELSPAVDGLVRTWGDGASQLWQVDDAAALEAAIARGRLARTEVEPRRFREVGLLERPTAPGGEGRLLLPARLRPDAPPVAATGSASDVTADVSDTSAIALVGDPLAVRAVTDADADLSGRTDLWPALTELLREACVAAATRGEVVVVERGADAHQPWPYALFAITGDGQGPYLSHVETSPAPPHGVAVWARAGRARNPDGTDGASMSTAATRDAVGLAGYLLAVAASGWVTTPLDLALTFTAGPAGAVTLAGSAPDPVPPS